MECIELVVVVEMFDVDELVDFVFDLLQGVIDDVFCGLLVEECEQLCVVMFYLEELVGLIMDFDMVIVCEDVMFEVVLCYLCWFDEFFDYIDQFFVVDCDECLKGVLFLNILLVNEVNVEVGVLMQIDFIELEFEDFVEDVVKVFECYDFVLVLVVDLDGKLVGCVIVNEVVDYIWEEVEYE